MLDRPTPRTTGVESFELVEDEPSNCHEARNLGERH